MGRAIRDLTPVVEVPVPSSLNGEQAMPQVLPVSTLPARLTTREGATPPLTPGEDMPPPERALDFGPDQSSSVSRARRVGAVAVQDDEEGRRTAAPHYTAADLAILHANLGHYARQYADVQKVRIAMSNRASAMARDGIEEMQRKAILASLEMVEDAEGRIGRELERLAKAHPLRAWVDAAPGLGLLGFARLMGETGPLDRFATVSKLWKFLGMHVTPEGRAPRREKGVAWTHTNCRGGHPAACPRTCPKDHHPNCTADGIGTAYSPSGRVLCHLLGENIVKLGRGEYRELYDRKKADYEVGRPDWTQARRHNAAMRYAAKALLKDLWIAWHQVMPS